jgi:predicted ester cyclase
MSVDPAHEDLLNRILRTFEACDAEATAALYEADAVMYEYPDVINGREAIRDSMAAWFTSFPDIQWELKNLMSSGDTFIAEGIFKGTHTGPMQTAEGAIPPTGKAVEMPCCFIGRVSANGLIAEDRTYFNAAIMMEQLGLG